MANAIFWAFVAFLLLALPLAMRALWRRSTGRCLGCGYQLALAELTATKGSANCPECGIGSGLRIGRLSQYDPSMSRSTPDPDSRTQGAHASVSAPATGVPEAMPAPAAASGSGLALTASPEMRHQSAYVWLIFFSSLDIMLTWAILRRGGEEVNPVAKQIIAMWGLHGAIVFKFALMLFVIVSCEVISRKKEKAGRRLALAAVAIAAFPVIYSFGLLVDHILLRPPPIQ